MRAFAILPMLAVLSAAPLPSDDAAVVRAALQKIGGGGKKVYCVSPTLLNRPFANMRANMAEAPAIAGLSLDARRQAVGQWQAQARWTGTDGRPLSGAVRQQLDAAIVALLVPDPIPSPHGNSEAIDQATGTAAAAVPGGPTITPDLLQPGQQLQPTVGCISVTLSNVAYHGDWAFVEIGIVAGPLAGAGDQWAFRRQGGTWRWIAGNRIWVS